MANLIIPHKHRIHRDLWSLSSREWPSEQVAITAIVAAFAKYGIRAEPPWLFADGYKIPCNACNMEGRFHNTLSIQFSNGELKVYVT